MSKNLIGIGNKFTVAAQTRQPQKDAKKGIKIEEVFWQEENKKGTTTVKKTKRKELKGHRSPKKDQKAGEKKILSASDIAIEKPSRKKAGQGNKIGNKQVNKLIKSVPLSESALVENKTNKNFLQKDHRTITDSAKIFEWKPDDIDIQIEKSLKIAYASYEQTRLKSLKKRHPNLRVSQLKEIIFKEWQNAAEQRPIKKNF